MSDATTDPLDGLFDAEEPAKLPRKGNITDIAAHCHVPRNRALSLLKAAGMRRDKEKKFLFAEAVAVILSSIDPARSTGHQAGGDESALAGTNTAPVAVTELASAKAAYERLRAQKAELEVAKLTGRLIPRDDVLAAARDIGTHVRAGLAGVAAKIAGDAAALTNPVAVQALIANAIDDALLRLCELPEALTGAAQ